MDVRPGFIVKFRSPWRESGGRNEQMVMAEVTEVTPSAVECVEVQSSGEPGRKWTVERHRLINPNLLSI